MASSAKGIFIVGAKRTAFGTFGGALKNYKQTELQTVAAKAALDSANVKGEYVDSTIIGHVISSSSTEGAYLPRHVGLYCDVPYDKPALAVNRLCGSGFQSVVNGAQEIMLGTANVVLTGGVENMSQAPHILRNLRFGTSFTTQYNLEDSLWSSLTDTYCKLPMALTAENLAEQYKISREEVEEFALSSQLKWQQAQSSGVFDAEITPITLKKKEPTVFSIDEHPRPKTTKEGLAKLPALFKKNGTVTAGTASGISDGAAAVILASEAALKKYDLKPLARLVAYSYVGVQPDIMGIGPVPAIQNLLNVSGKKLQDIDLIEINEAFGAQTIACAKALALDTTKLNVNGGAIAIGHPLGASGSRITAHLVHELKRRNLNYGIGAACIGGGQGIALLLQSCQ